MTLTLAAPQCGEQNILVAFVAFEWKSLIGFETVFKREFHLEE